MIPSFLVNYVNVRLCIRAYRLDKTNQPRTDMFVIGFHRLLQYYPFTSLRTIELDESIYLHTIKVFTQPTPCSTHHLS